MDRIKLRGMKFYGYHGVLPEETTLGQTFIVDVELGLDAEQAAVSDDLALTVNYAQVYEDVKSIMEGTPSKLLEKVCRELIMRLMTVHPLIEFVSVRITKPNPPFAMNGEGVSVELQRRRESR